MSSGLDPDEHCREDDAIMSQTETLQLRLSPPSGRRDRFRPTSPSRTAGDSLVVSIPSPLRAVLEREALRTGRSAEGLLRDVITRYLNSLPPVLLD